MIRVFIILSCLALGLLHAQEPATDSTNRPVLKALPIGGDDDITSQPIPNEVVSMSKDTPAVEADETNEAPAAVVIDEPAEIASLSNTTVSNAKPEGLEALRLQVFLDKSNFGPGVIDGRMGQFGELAVRSWNEVKGHPLDDWSAVMLAAKNAVSEPLVTVTVPVIANKWVNPSLPTKRSLQASAKRMSYRSIVEFMAERYHSDVPYLTEINAGVKIQNLKPGDTLIVPNVDPFEIEKLSGAKYEADGALSERHVVVNTQINQARIFEAAPAALVVDEFEDGSATVSKTKANRALVASFPITPGKPKFIKFGTWKLLNMVELPNWRYDQQLLDTGKRSNNALNIPPGPNSPVGVIWNGTSRPGIGMHGTSDPETIGRARSAGCIRLANWDAIRLPNLIRPGATVEIR
jgi:lipoprotein-anchoring transpeptidase ErfK/SrfK